MYTSSLKKMLLPSGKLIQLWKIIHMAILNGKLPEGIVSCLYDPIRIVTS